MEKKQAEERIKRLKALVEKYRYAYNVQDKSLASDAVNDSLKHELQELEEQFPDLVTPDSPTQRVGGEPLKGFQEVRHFIPMLSLTDAFSLEDMRAWYERVAKVNPQVKHASFYAELKVDGLAVSLVYEKGIFVRAATRGNGTIGEDVTQNLKTIEAIPLKIQYRPHSALAKYEKQIYAALSKTIEIRGEVFMTKCSLERLNEKQAEKGGRPFANPRNVAAGSVRQLNSQITAARELDFFAYALPTELGFETHEQEHILCSALGVKVNGESTLCHSLEEVSAFHALWEQKKEKLDFWFDGVVVTVNERDIFQKLGVVGKAPRGSIAFKFAAQEATTVVQDIIVQVGRTGKLTPVAHLKGVHVSGVTVTRATLHNQDEIDRKDIRIGDTVIVRRAGEVIPEVVKSLKELRHGSERKFQMPKHCPICASPIVKDAGEVDYRCSNRSCFAQELEQLKHFVSKGAFDIEGLGPKILEQLVQEGLIKDAADLFTLTVGDLQPLERFAQKSAQNSVDSIQSRRRLELAHFIYALGIRHVGEETAYDLAEHFGTFERLAGAEPEEFEAIYGIGTAGAKSLAQWFTTEHNQTLIEKLKAYIEITPMKHRESRPLTGKTFVLTGGLESMSRDAAKEKVRLLGGDVSGTVSKQTDYVVVGADSGSKLAHARALGVKVIDETEFLKLLS